MSLLQLTDSFCGEMLSHGSAERVKMWSNTEMVEGKWPVSKFVKGTYTPYVLVASREKELQANVFFFVTESAFYQHFVVAKDPLLSNMKLCECCAQACVRACVCVNDLLRRQKRTSKIETESDSNRLCKSLSAVQINCNLAELFDSILWMVSIPDVLEFVESTQKHREQKRSRVN